MNNNTHTNNVGKTMYRVIVDGVDYGFFTARAKREFYARLEAKRS